jgi:hypothetical protein
LAVSCPVSTGESATRMAAGLHRRHRKADMDPWGRGLSLAAGVGDPLEVDGVPGADTALNGDEEPRPSVGAVRLW